MLEDLTETELRSLYNQFVSYRDNECNGLAKMPIKQFLKKRYTRVKGKS